MEWKYIKATEFCESVRDGTHDTPKPTEHGYKLVTGKHIKDGRIDPSDAYCISEEDYNKINQRSLVEKWDVLMSMIGTVGEVAVVKNDPEYAIKNVALFKCGGSELKGQWLSYYLKSPVAKGHMSGNQKGSSQQFLSLKQLRELPIAVTDEETMEKIIKLLSVYDLLIENNRHQIKILEEAAQHLYKEWFIDLHFPGHDDAEIVDGIPFGWEKRKVVELTSVLRRGISPTYNDEGKYTVINQKCIRSSIMSLDEARKQEKEYPDEINLQDADTVICSTGTGTLGRVGQVCGDYPETTIDSHVTLVRAKLYENLLYHSIKANQEYLMGMGRGSTNQQELYRNVIEEMVILWPSSKIALQFEEIAQSIHRKITVLDGMTARSIEARDRLLPKLMSGEIEL